MISFVAFLKRSFEILVIKKRIFEDNKNVLCHDYDGGYITMHLSKPIKLYTWKRKILLYVNHSSIDPILKNKNHDHSNSSLFLILPLPKKYFNRYLLSLSDMFSKEGFSKHLVGRSARGFVLIPHWPSMHTALYVYLGCREDG